MKRKPSAEARAWLAGQNVVRSIGGLGSIASVKYVNRLYTDGAIRVTVVDIRGHKARPRVSDNAASETAEGVVIELPGEATARRKLFAHEAKCAVEQGFDPTPDEGQSLMFLKTD
jgi:hypothetical protein